MAFQQKSLNQNMKIQNKKHLKIISIYIIMRYLLVIKDTETQKELESREYRSILKISKDLKTTYCSCYENFLCNEDPMRQRGKKRSQVKFNQKYEIKSLD